MNEEKILDPVLLQQIEESEQDAPKTETISPLEVIFLVGVTFIVFPLIGYLTY